MLLLWSVDKTDSHSMRYDTDTKWYLCYNMIYVSAKTQYHIIVHNYNVARRRQSNTVRFQLEVNIQVYR